MFTIQRKLALLLGAALAVVAVAAPAASADVPFEVRDASTSEPCPELILWSELYSSGGCFVDDFEGQFSLFMGSTQIGNYETDFDLVIGPDGTGAAFNQTMNSAPPYGFARVPCRDQATDYVKYWPITVRALGSGEFVADMKICIAPTGNPYSGTGWTTFTVDIPHFGSDGWTELSQSVDGQFIRYAQWESPNTVDLVETE